MNIATKDREILSLLAEGLSAKEIACKLNCSAEDVETTVRRLRRNTNARNTVHLVAVYLKELLTQSPKMAL